MVDTRRKQWVLSGVVRNIDTDNQTMVVQIDSRCGEIPILENMPNWIKVSGADFEVSVPWDQADNEDLSTIDWVDWEALGHDDLTNDELIDRLTKHSKGN